jgi:hypothetical protein
VPDGPLLLPQPAHASEHARVETARTTNELRGDMEMLRGCGVGAYPNPADTDVHLAVIIAG